MLFFPIAFLIFILFILFFPILFLLGYFHIVVIGFQNLGISPNATLIILFLMLMGSLVNIPLTKKKLIFVREPRFFGLFSVPKVETQYLTINVGGALIPILLSFYFLLFVKNQGFGLKPIFIAILLMTIVSKIFSKVIPKKGIVLSSFVPPVFSAIFAVILAPGFAASCAFISGVLGTLIGADILNLRRLKNYGGFLSIGGAGIFDGIFLVGIASALLSGV